jgi:hypothetical protein
MQTEMALVIPAGIIRGLPAEVQNALLAALVGCATQLPGPAEPDEDEEGLPDLSIAQATRFLETCSDKVKNALKVIVGGSSRYFQIADVARAVNSDPGDLAGVLAGITRRTRTILGDPKASLIAWDAASIIWDANDEYLDQRGRVSEATYRSLRRALQID